MVKPDKQACTRDSGMLKPETNRSEQRRDETRETRADVTQLFTLPQPQSLTPRKRDASAPLRDVNVDED